MIAIHSMSSMWKMTQKLFSQVQQGRVGNALCQRTFILRLLRRRVRTLIILCLTPRSPLAHTALGIRE